MDLPDVVVERIIDSIQSRMPPELTIVRTQRRVLRFTVSAQPWLGPPHKAQGYWGSQIGVRNRDGVTPLSIAWARWMVLDSLLRMSRAIDLPWDRDTARQSEAYAEVRGEAVHGWVADIDATFRVDFPDVQLAGLSVARPSGPRLPVPLARSYRLPTSGPVTSPKNRRRQDHI